MTSSIIETMMNIRITPMSMKTVMKMRRRKTEEEKKEILINTGFILFLEVQIP